MDDSFMRFRFYTGAVDKMRRLPSEVFRTSIWATFVNDRSGVEQRDRLNIDHVCWSTDYPHSICEWPNSRRVLESVFQGVALDAVEKMVWSNARDLYSIDLPPERPDGDLRPATPTCSRRPRFVRRCCATPPGSTGATGT